jgi:hypothetical protein
VLSVLPEFFEPIERHLGVSHCVHDILVAHVVLGCSGVMAIIGTGPVGRRIGLPLWSFP